jgi:FlaA1/EpsC-like NDP-sugar epimerase
MGASKRIAAEKHIQMPYENAKSLNKTILQKFTRFECFGIKMFDRTTVTKQIAEGGPITITHPEILGILHDS